MYSVHCTVQLPSIIIIHLFLWYVHEINKLNLKLINVGLLYYFNVNDTGPAPAIAGVDPAFQPNHLPQEHTDDTGSLWDGLLWAVPKRRRSAQKNRTRRRAVEKMIKPFKYMTTCDTCGHPKKLNFLCG